ncbi:hypothetical protein [Chromatium okenii]|uniref:hypothetical protein n=1 Tax=Chromatium okenii TaxID=61644 RepID=UPI001F5BF763|nr:hypothetical protein [Chromatium okenii]
MTNADSNPFLDEQQVLCSLDVLLASPAIKRAVSLGNGMCWWSMKRITSAGRKLPSARNMR